jgi:hypothetical protein
MPRKDLQSKKLESEKLESVVWKTGEMADVLATVRAFVTDRARAAEDWYFAAKKPTRFWGRVFRVGAILLTAFAALLPMLNEIHRSWQIEKEFTGPALLAETNAAAPPINAVPMLKLEKLLVSRHWLNPVWSAVLLGVAAALLALDRFYGTTSGWVRYVLSAQQLTEALDDFQLAFEAQRLSWGKPEPTPEQALAALAVIQKFLKQVDGIVSDETKTWAAEFTEVVKQLDEQMKLASQAKRQSAIQLTVTNGDQCKPTWKLHVGGRVPEDRVGKEASVEVPGGLYVVRITGEISGKPVQAEKAVNVTAGEIQKVELTLA